jgi:hypothetical protein
MKLHALALSLAIALTPGLALAAVSCRELPKAERYVHTKLKPGPNTQAALRHLAAAKHARTAEQCSMELARVDYYARRSRAADRRTH